MLIGDIKPYERNARHNDKAIPKVAESIRKFGLRGSIVLESRDNPVIVCGHTRVAAAKSLGWTEIPDDHIEYCDGLTQDEIDAFRLIDNKTGEIATWNVALLKSEAKRLNGKLDFARYGFDFKSKVKPYGAERARTDDYYNLRLCDIDDCGPDGMPLLAPTDIRPARLIGFNYAKSWNEPKTGVGIHFFLDDYQFERIWNKPEEYTRLLASFDMACAPDWSLYLDMPRPMQQWNVYRSRAIGDWWQRQGLAVVPTLSWSDENSYEYCFNGQLAAGRTPLDAIGEAGYETALADEPEGMIRSGGYVLDTLKAAVWCLVTTDDYAGCALKAVNLGDDTDTTAAVAGGLAGIVYGIDSIPAEWLAKLRGKDVIDACLFA